VCTASDVNQTQTPPLLYVSSAHTRDVHSCTDDIVRYMAAAISYADESAIDIAISCNRYDHYTAPDPTQLNTL